MGLAWGGNYRFEKGDVVRVSGKHPWKGRLGTIEIAYGSDQFGVRLTPTWVYAIRDITFWGKDLQLVSTGRE